MEGMPSIEAIFADFSKHKRGASLLQYRPLVPAESNAA
jgi:hypothetical protein